MNTVSRNLKVGYILFFLIEMYLPVAVWFFFYSRFMNVTQIAVITGFQIIVWNLFEVPTGAFADLYGRKLSTIIAFGLYGTCMLVAAFTTKFWIFMILEFFKGIANALNSGSLEALLYDSLKESGQEKRWDKVIANTETLLWTGLFIGSVAGGFLYYLWYPLPYILQGFIYIIAAIISLQLVEPKLDSTQYNLKTVLAQNLQGFRELFASVRLTHLTFILTLVGAGYMIAASILGISQAKEYGLDSRGVGLLFGLGYLITAAASQIYPRLKSSFGARILLIGLTAILMSTFIFARFVGVILGAILIVMRISTSTLFRNVKSSLVNQAVSSKNRATSLSALQLLTQLPYAFGAYFIGRYIDATSPNQFAFLLGVIIIALLFVVQLTFITKPKFAPAKTK